MDAKDFLPLDFWFDGKPEPYVTWLHGIEYRKNLCEDCPPEYTPTPPPYYSCNQCRVTKCPAHWCGGCANQDRGCVCEPPSNHWCGACETCAPDGKLGICPHACQKCHDIYNGAPERTCVDICAECATEGIKDQ